MSKAPGSPACRRYGCANPPTSRRRSMPSRWRHRPAVYLESCTHRGVHAMNDPKPAPGALRRPMPAELVEELRSRFAGRFSTAAAVREHHGRDESPFDAVPPDAVVHALDADEVAAVVGACARHRVPVIPYGVGTSLEGHLLAVQGGVSIDLSQMNRVVSINAEDLTATVQPGVTRKQLNDELKDTGL